MEPYGTRRTPKVVRALVLVAHQSPVVKVESATATAQQPPLARKQAVQVSPATSLARQSRTAVVAAAAVGALTVVLVVLVAAQLVAVEAVSAALAQQTLVVAVVVETLRAQLEAPADLAS